MNTRRILKELQEMHTSDDPCLGFWNNPKDTTTIYVHVIGPRDTAYEGSHMEIRMNLTNDYPLSPPKVKCLTKTFHPNIDMRTGEICMDILSSKGWTPSWTVISIARAFLVLLQSPVPSSPLNCDAANLIRLGDDIGYTSLSKYYAKLYATKENLIKQYKY